MEKEQSYEEMMARLESGVDLTESEQVLALTMIREIGPMPTEQSTAEDDDIRFVGRLPAEPKTPQIRLVSKLD
jgi:hypothetical protein